MGQMLQQTLASLHAAWRYRGYILSSVKREFQSRYRNSLLGAVWNILNPLTTIAIYTIIFSQVMRARLPGLAGTFDYSIYLCAGIIPWGLFSETIARGQNVFLENGNLLKKLNFPRFCLPIIVVLNAWLNFLIIFLLFLFFLALIGRFPSATGLALIPLLLIQTILAIGLGVAIGVLNVFFRDVGHFATIALQFWFWLTPIVYTLGTLPAWASALVQLNPMTPIITAYQHIFLLNRWPDWSSLWPAVVSGILISIFGMILFKNHAGEMVDEL